MSDIAAAVAAVRDGHIIGIPTDTVYGIGADPFNAQAMEGLFLAKDRPGIKPIPILIASIDDASTVAEVDEVVLGAAERFWPGGLTIVARCAANVPDWVGSTDRRTVGIRVPSHPTALEVLTATGPLAVTSANRSGAAPALDSESAATALGDAVSVYVSGAAFGGEASTVVDLSGSRPRVLRQGPVEWMEAE
jgi:tRNA threonylcarbamoyl adenosine modification protein (Sua5/YciO/YrdC/YwlC family)